MEAKTTGLSLDMLITPGEILKDEIAERDMTQDELAKRCGVSAKHISDIINGKKAISLQLAEKLHFALGISSSFWNNLQANYEQQYYELTHQNKVAPQELDIIKNAKVKSAIQVIKRDLGFITTTAKNEELVLELRKFVQVSNLTNIPQLTYNQAAFRVKHETHSIDIYVMWIWIALCKHVTQSITCANTLDKLLLKDKLETIKALMFNEPNAWIPQLTEIFSSCGIAFSIVPNFSGAPVQGYIQNTDDKTLLCMTLRGAQADIFWFSLFHEIAHILNEDCKKQLVDFQHSDSEIEKKADRFSANILIPPKLYTEFVVNGVFTETSICNFAKEVGVLPCIVLGRLQKEKRVGYAAFPHLKLRYKWAK